MYPRLQNPYIASCYESLFAALSTTSLRSWLGDLADAINRAFADDRHGDWPRWQDVLLDLPRVQPERVFLDADEVGVAGGAITPDALKARLMGLHPWRKGPYALHGVRIDTEWRSDWKWQRLSPHIRPLDGKLVLDVGCGNGYHLWRMLGAGARRVIGVDPTLLSVVQFLAVKHFMGDWPADVVPVGVEDIPAGLRAFDTVFSMGVLYHRRSPLDHLLELKGLLKPGGELVLETLVVEGECGHALLPADRYARMRNVWFLPSCGTLEAWLRRCGFREVRCVDVTPTTVAEQRSTEWMRFESLAECLDPVNPALTVEGLPAPVRAIFVCS